MVAGSSSSRSAPGFSSTCSPPPLRGIQRREEAPPSARGEDERQVCARRTYAAPRCPVSATSLFLSSAGRSEKFRGVIVSFFFLIWLMMHGFPQRAHTHEHRDLNDSIHSQTQPPALPPPLPQPLVTEHLD